MLSFGLKQVNPTIILRSAVCLFVYQQPRFFYCELKKNEQFVMKNILGQKGSEVSMKEM